MSMTAQTQEKLACSLTAETTELLPFLPYLLQDFWELGSDPDVISGLIEKNVRLLEDTRILDLACGKGAVSVKAAQKLRVKIKGIDLFTEFIDYAREKAQEYNVADLCEFAVGDINEAVKTEAGYDCVILGAASDVLGSPAETLHKLKAVTKQGGYILIDEGYLSDEITRTDVKWRGDAFLTKREWLDLFEEAGLELIETISESDIADTNNPDSTEGMAYITARANELIEKHPDKRAMFEGYIHSQQNEYDDIDNDLVCVTWILRKNCGKRKADNE